MIDLRGFYSKSLFPRWSTWHLESLRAVI